MCSNLSMRIFVGMALALAWLNVADAQTQSPGPSPEAGTEMGNLGTLPFVATEQILLRPEQKTALRQLEDRQIKELRDFEDNYDTDLRRLRIRQAQERDQMIRSFRGQ